jgi:hypothetical protein
MTGYDVIGSTLMWFSTFGGMIEKLFVTEGGSILTTGAFTITEGGSTDTFTEGVSTVILLLTIGVSSDRFTTGACTLTEGASTFMLLLIGGLCTVKVDWIFGNVVID